MIVIVNIYIYIYINSESNTNIILDLPVSYNLGSEMRMFGRVLLGMLMMLRPS